MKIIILGSGQVGQSLASSLVDEVHDVTLVDTDAVLLKNIQERVDLRTVVGKASYPSVLESAGTEDADMIIALTQSDETNIVACQVAYALFHTPTKIARIRTREYLSRQSELFVQEVLPIDVLINPEYLISQHVQQLIEHPGSLQVLSFSEGKIKLLATRADKDGPLIGKRLPDVLAFMQDIETKVMAVYRNNHSIGLDDNTVIQAGDEVFFIASSENAMALTAKLGGDDKPYKRILLAGGGNIGFHLAKALENKYQIRIIEHDPKRTRFLSESLNKAIVLQSDVANRDMLIEENIENTDVFCALTDDDETNILSSMLAKRLGARKVMSLINRQSYVDLIESSAIDVAISPQQITLSTLLAHIRKGGIVEGHSLRRGAAEAIEVKVHGDEKTSKVVGRSIEQIKLPASAAIGAIVRAGKVIMAAADTEIKEHDHVIVFLANKADIKVTGRLFEVGAAFI